jgi:hypothetical protein
MDDDDEGGLVRLATERCVGQLYGMSVIKLIVGDGKPCLGFRIPADDRRQDAGLAAGVALLDPGLDLQHEMIHEDRGRTRINAGEGRILPEAQARDARRPG